MSNANVPMRRNNEEQTRVAKCNEEKPAMASDHKIDELSDAL